MTTIGDILDEFFSPFSRERLWLMPQNDNYTKRVRKWQPVINAVNTAKANLLSDCAVWSSSRMTSKSWVPAKTDPPVYDAAAMPIWVASPPGTEPNVCRSAFEKYVASKAARTVQRILPGPVLIPEIQTSSLYTCSIGSFGLYVTVDKIDCAKQTATMNFWMYNAMDRGSFGAYANHKAFKYCGMERQYMWWNWTESVDWSLGTIRTVPPKKSSWKW